MFRKLTTTVLATALLATTASADEINVYSYRQPELIKPLFDAFTAETGTDVNVTFLKKGMVEKLLAEGNRSPADLIVTVDISRLNGLVEAGVTQAVTSKTIAANIPAAFRDPAGHWFGLTSRARIVYASKDRVADGEVTTYEDLASDKWKGRICIRSGTNAYNLALTSAVRLMSISPTRNCAEATPTSTEPSIDQPTIRAVVCGFWLSVSCITTAS